jgi:hypothetical protein
MRRAAAGVAAVLALVVPAVAYASASHDAAVARKGITLALKHRWLKPPDAQRYRAAVNRALSDIKTLAPLRGSAIASQLSQLTPLSDSYTSPRALSLFSQLAANLSYLETHALPNTRVDITDDDGVVYRWFPRLGFEFHPLANFGALNNDAASGDVESTRTLADALLARAIPRDRRLLWEYQFRFGGGRPPWASGMAQAVAAQALARSSALLADPNLGAAAVRAFASVPPFLLSLPSGPWIRLYGFNGQVVLNAQLQAIVSLLEYGTTTNSAAATALAQRLSTTAEKLFPRFDTGDWSRYELGGGYAPRDYQKFVTDLLAKLARQTGDPFWVATSQRFHSYYYDPPQVTQPQPAASPTIWPQPLDGYLDAAPIPITLSMRASVSLSVAGKVTTYRLNAGSRTLTWKPPAGLAQGTYPVKLSAVTYAGNRTTVQLPPVVVRWDTTPPAFTTPPSFDQATSTLTWQVDDPGTPWLALAVDLVDPAGVNPPQTIDLGRVAFTSGTPGTTPLTLPPGTWQATLRAANSAALTTPLLLGTFTQPG